MGVRTYGAVDYGLRCGLRMLAHAVDYASLWITWLTPLWITHAVDFPAFRARAHISGLRPVDFPALRAWVQEMRGDPN